MKCVPVCFSSKHFVEVTDTVNCFSLSFLALGVCQGCVFQGMILVQDIKKKTESLHIFNIRKPEFSLRNIRPRGSTTI